MLDEVGVAERLHRFACLLGWPQLQSLQREMQDGCLARWYEPDRQNYVRLQINHHPQGQSETFHAIAFALRYRLCSGWQQFQLHTDPQKLTAEAERVRTWLDFSWYATDDRRHEFRKRHPECAGLTWNGLRENESYLRGRAFEPVDWIESEIITVKEWPRTQPIARRPPPRRSTSP